MSVIVLANRESESLYQYLYINHTIDILCDVMLEITCIWGYIMVHVDNEKIYIL